MTCHCRTLLFALMFAAVPVQAARLPDTGQDICFGETAADNVAASNAASIASDTGTHPRQDCRYGRDAAAATGKLAKIGGGVKGFDYTKISNNGAALAANAVLGTAPADWACTRDNVTDLTWETKTLQYTDMRFVGHSYTWYNSDATTNGGVAGSTGGDTCFGTLPGGLCNTEAYITAVNNSALCFFNDWRQPTLRELLTLMNADGSRPSIDPTYFPNQYASFVFTATTYATNPALAWYVLFADGYTNANNKSSNGHVRLVRGKRF